MEWWSDGVMECWSAGVLERPILFAPLLSAIPTGRLGAENVQEAMRAIIPLGSIRRFWLAHATE